MQAMLCDLCGGNMGKVPTYTISILDHRNMPSKVRHLEYCTPCGVKLISPMVQGKSQVLAMLGAMKKAGEGEGEAEYVPPQLADIVLDADATARALDKSGDIGSEYDEAQDPRSG